MRGASSDVEFDESKRSLFVGVKIQRASSRWISSLERYLWVLYSRRTWSHIRADTIPDRVRPRELQSLAVPDPYHRLVTSSSPLPPTSLKRPTRYFSANYPQTAGSTTPYSAQSFPTACSASRRCSFHSGNRLKIMSQLTRVRPALRVSSCYDLTLQSRPPRRIRAQIISNVAASKHAPAMNQAPCHLSITSALPLLRAAPAIGFPISAPIAATV